MIGKQEPEAGATASYRARESWRDWRTEANLLITLARVTPGQRVLEVGCGGGGLMRLVGKQGIFAVGVETSVEALNLAQARQMSPDRGGALMEFARVGRDAPLPFAPGSFDALIGQHLVEHLEQAGKAFCEYARVLKSGGRLAIATPNANYADPEHFADADHVHVFTPKELVDSVSRAGFTLETCTTVFPFLSRARPLRATSVIAYRLFCGLPFFASRGRTIILGARKP
jgi:SAM-dependent methyltransferase